MSLHPVHLVEALYDRLAERHKVAREVLGRPLTLSEKILFSHLAERLAAPPVRGKATLFLHPDRVAMQDATAQTAILQFMLTGRKTAAVPSTVHCDHLILARVGAAEDLKDSQRLNDEVFRFLRSASERYGIGFWQPGSGIIHQVILENYAFPGGLLIGTDSHTPNAGGLGMAAIGVGGADAVEVMAGEPWSLRNPKLIGVHLRGKLGGWTAPKDVILRLAGILTVKGGTGAIVEYFGEGAASISCTGKATITNMGAEIGATTSIFPCDEKMLEYLRATDRKDIADLARRHMSSLAADAEVLQSPEKFFDRIIEIDLSALEPHVVGPHTPDLARPISQLKADVEKNGWPTDISYALIGSCTNSSYEDLDRAASVAAQAVAAGMKSQTGFMVSPGSEQIYATIRRDGQMETFESMGAVVLANACGPCIGQWKRSDVPPGQANSILTSFNRNFKKRNDGSADTHAFIGSPEIVTAMALAGTLAFNPLTDALAAPDGSEVRLSAPTGAELPVRGFVAGRSGFIAPVEGGTDVHVDIAEKSERIEVLVPFAAPRVPEDFEGMLLLLKAKGKCTTDHISQAGPWLRYRGHLTNISANMFLGAENAFRGGAGSGYDVLSGEENVAFPDLARRYKDAGKGWVVVGDENYGEGSSREHAAMEPRRLGCRVVLAKSFARIHETNLKKQGLLPLWFADPADYDRFRETDRITIRGLDGLAPDRPLEVELRHEDGGIETIHVRHSLMQDQIGWFRAGSALNEIRMRGET